MRFEIKRSKWLRGEGDEKSWLLRNSDQRMCCMGQVSSQLGIPDDAMRGLHTLNALALKLPDPTRLAPLMNGRNELGWVGLAYGFNDARAIPEAERETKLSALAAANGHEFVFVD